MAETCCFVTVAEAGIPRQEIGLHYNRSFRGEEAPLQNTAPDRGRAEEKRLLRRPLHPDRHGGMNGKASIRKSEPSALASVSRKGST